MAREIELLSPQLGRPELPTADRPTRLIFPGVNGVPYRGSEVPLLKPEEMEQLERVQDGRAAMFVLSRQPDVDEYNRIIDNTYKGIYEVHREEVNWSESLQSYVIMLRWGELAYEQPNAKTQRVTLNGQGQIRFANHAPLVQAGQRVVSNPVRGGH
jgi:hypothetical protein